MSYKTYKSIDMKGNVNYIDEPLVNAMVKGLQFAETGNMKPIYGDWIRAVKGKDPDPITGEGGGSFAYGPGQLNSIAASDMLNRPKLFRFYKGTVYSTTKLFISNGKK